MKLSCFSAVKPVMGWNQWVKCVAPFSVAHSFMASAMAFATGSSRGFPPAMQDFQAQKTWGSSRFFMVDSLNTSLPKISGTWMIS